MAPWQQSPRKGPSDASTIPRAISLRMLIMLPLGIVIFGVVLYTLQASGKFPAVAYGQLRDTLPSYVSLSRSILSTKQKEVEEKDFREMWNAMEANQLEDPVNGGQLSNATAEHISEIVRAQLETYLAVNEKKDVQSGTPKLLSDAVRLPDTVAGQISEIVKAQLDVHFDEWNKQLEAVKSTVSQAAVASSAISGEVTSTPEQPANVSPLGVEQLLANWTALYNLGNDPTWVKGSVTPGDFLPAPHLQDCAAVTNMREEWDTRQSDGSLPAWFTADVPGDVTLKASQMTPQPPWVLGSDLDNLPETRLTQAAIWEHQHPKNCRDPAHKFLLVNWWVNDGHGIGSQLHGWSVFFAVAKAYNRILVMTDSFTRADHEGCQGPGKKSSLGCYFMPPEDPVCKQVALELINEQHRAGFAQPIHPHLNTRPEIDEVLRTSTERLLQYGVNLDQAFSFWDLVPNGTWGEPWNKHPISSEEVQGKMFDGGELTNKMRWWRAQATSYLLRFPSEYLCTLCNRERNRAYGRKVAVELLAARNRQLLVSTEDDFNKKLMVGEMEHMIWSPASGLSPYIPRPIISIHVRQGDKVKEMRIFDFGSYMAQAERVRRHDPSVKTIWLSTEMQSVIEDTRLYPSWEFLFTNTSRIYGQAVLPNDRENLDNAFVNLMLSVECDYFVGALGSNWNRLIDELRKTVMGRLRAGHISMNIAE